MTTLPNPRRFSVLLALLPLLAHRADADVIVVDQVGGPGVDFTDLPAAVAAAASGDLIRVASGNYSGFTIEAKSLTIEPFVGAGIFATGTVRIRDLAPTQSVVLRYIRPVIHNPGLGLEVDDCAGSVWIERCDFGCSGTAICFVDASIRDSQDVAIVNGRFDGTVGIPPFGPSAALSIESSVVYLYETAVLGSSPLDATCLQAPLVGASGSAALYASASFVSVHGGSIYGGDGQSVEMIEGGGCTSCSCGSGGPGIELANGSTVELRGTNYGGGFLGTDPGSQPGCTSGELGEPYVADAGSALVEQPLIFLGAVSASPPLYPLYSGETEPLLITGQAGDIVFVYASLATTLTPEIPGVTGPALLSLPPVLLGATTLTQISGSLDVAVPALPPALSHLVVYLQALRVPASGAATLTAPASVTILP